jgi:hypothetical protein
VFAHCSPRRGEERPPPTLKFLPAGAFIGFVFMLIRESAELLTLAFCLFEVGGEQVIAKFGDQIYWSMKHAVIYAMDEILLLTFAELAFSGRKYFKFEATAFPGAYNYVTWGEI